MKLNLFAQVKTLFKYLISYLFVYVFFVVPLGSFIEYLADHEVLKLGQDFDSGQIIWSDPTATIFWPNTLKFIIVVLISVLCGFLFAQLSENAGVLEKIEVSFINSFLSLSGTFVFLILEMVFKDREGIEKLIESLGTAYSTYPRILIFTILMIITSFFVCFFTISIVTKRIKTGGFSFYDWQDKKLFGIKWYHFIWLPMAVTVYSKIIYLILFNSGVQILTLLSEIKWFEFLGIYKTEEHNAVFYGFSDPARWGLNEGSTHIDQIFYHLFGSAVFIALVLSVFYFLILILSGETKIKVIYKVLLAVLVGLVIPFSLTMYFPVLSSVRTPAPPKIKDLPIIRNGKYGFEDTEGNVVIEPKFDSAGAFENGLAPVEVENLWGYIDKKGDYVVKPIYDSASPFFNNCASVEQNNVFYFIDPAGNILRKTDYEDVGFFENDFAQIKKNGKYGFIDSNLNEAIKPQFVNEGDFSEGLARAAVSKTSSRNNEKYGFVDKTGKFVIEPLFDNAGDFHDSFAAVKVKSKWGFIDATGKMVIKPKFEGVQYFSFGLASFGINLNKKGEGGKWGFIDTKGDVVIKPKFDFSPFTAFIGDTAEVQIGNKDYEIDRSGKTLNEINFDSQNSP